MGQKVGVVSVQKGGGSRGVGEKNVQFLIVKCAMKMKTIISSRLMTMTPWSIQIMTFKPPR